mmetsp:Transcript_5021/g.10844  ORF Transcript_5021/g.10844 Transcript_5021/m.10844 type:complete len:308 (-) Transcript_5021:994-1917(-)
MKVFTRVQEDTLREVEKGPKRRKCESLAGVNFVTPGEVVTDEAGVLRGHGTYLREGRLFASVAGRVERVNKLVSVIPISRRYKAEVGDVVVGRIAEVGQKKWSVDVGEGQDALLQLSAVNLPGGIQRRRTAEDQLNMRTFFTENDLISAEVQMQLNDGSVALHTRSMKYGKLVGGMSVEAPPALIKRIKQHFVHRQDGIDCIFGLNGRIWIAPSCPPSKGDGDRPVPHAATEKDRQTMARLRNAIVLLSEQFLVISPDTVGMVEKASIQAGIPPHEMLNPEYAVDLCREVRASTRLATADDDEEGDM